MLGWARVAGPVGVEAGEGAFVHTDEVSRRAICFEPVPSTYLYYYFLLYIIATLTPQLRLYSGEVRAARQVRQSAM